MKRVTLEAEKGDGAGAGQKGNEVLCSVRNKDTMRLLC